MTLQETIQNEIQSTVPQMIEDSVSLHSHLGGDSQQLNGQAFNNAPQTITQATAGTLSTGGAYNLNTSDSTLLTNALQRILDLETSLKAIGLLN